ncbi:MAG: alkaline phosphatase family protein [Alphaproteobacteria bacterium]|nr:alkaline phosphatase family protein [Alphaproteobacteria bacterium]
MRLSVRLAAVLWSVLAAIGVAQAAERTVIVVLFDGFAPAMVDGVKTPNFDLIKTEGAWSRHLVPVYPTMSLPNHTSFATGCWPEHHGVVQNKFFDPDRGADYDENGDADWLKGCEPMWQAAERQGVTAAALNFANRWNVKKKVALASVINPFVPWEETPSDEQILARGLELLKSNDAKRPRLIALYFRGPDHEAHVNGVTSPQVKAEVRKADAIVGRLMAGIKALPAEREATLIVGTDHGMIAVDPVVNLGRILNRHWIYARDAGDGGSAYLYLDKGESIERVEKVLGGYSQAFTVYRTGQHPAYSHLGHGSRVGDLMLVAKPPYYIAPSSSLPWYAHLMGMTWFWSDIFVPGDLGGLKASHGYDPAIPEMHGIFYAWGAGIARGKEVAQLDMIDIHPTAMSLLGLQPGVPVDGKVVSEAMVPAP